MRSGGGPPGLRASDAACSAGVALDVSANAGAVGGVVAAAAFGAAFAAHGLAASPGAVLTVQRCAVHGQGMLVEEGGAAGK